MCVCVCVDYKVPALRLLIRGKLLVFSPDGSLN